MTPRRHCPLIVAIAFSSAIVVASLPSHAKSINAGNGQISPHPPFQIQDVADFNTPWAIAFLPDGHMLVTEKGGKLFLTDQQGQKHQVSGVPKVMAEGQTGLLDVAIAPDFEDSRRVYFSYTKASRNGSSLVVSSATLTSSDSHPALTDITTVWQQGLSAWGGQPGGVIAFSPDGHYLFVGVGDRMQPDTAQDPDAPAGKILRLSLDGATPRDNPKALEKGTRAQTWSLGHRNPYGLAFSSSNRLWEVEMGPQGGDELNLIKPATNYGWADVSNGDNYNGTPIPDHSTKSDYEAPRVYWNPVISPGGMAFYKGDQFPAWDGSLLISALSGQGLVRVGMDTNDQVNKVERWNLGKRIRDVAIAPDGGVWIIADAHPGQLMKLIPEQHSR